MAKKKIKKDYGYVGFSVPAKVLGAVAKEVDKRAVA